jgi:hypothetical protein
VGQDDKEASQMSNLMKGNTGMATIVGNVLFVVVALVVVAAAGVLAIGLLGTLVGLLGLAIKVGIFAGAVYLVWLLIKKLTSAARSDY